MSFDAFYLLYVISCSEIYLCCQVKLFLLFLVELKFYHLFYGSCWHKKWRIQYRAQTLIFVNFEKKK